MSQHWGLAGPNRDFLSKFEGKDRRATYANWLSNEPLALNAQ